LSQASSNAERFWKHLEPLQGALERYCRYSIWDRNAVEDVLQSAVAKAFADFDLFAEGTNFRAWIFRYLNFEIRAANRMSRTKPHVELPADPISDDEWLLAFDEASFANLLDSPDEVLQQCDEVIAEAIHNLGDLEQATLMLKAVGGFKYREIAEILETPMGTVMSALSRGRRRIRHELTEYGREHGLLTPNQTRKDD